MNEDSNFLRLDDFAKSMINYIKEDLNLESVNLRAEKELLGIQQLSRLISFLMKEVPHVHQEPRSALALLITYNLYLSGQIEVPDSVLIEPNQN